MIISAIVAPVDTYKVHVTPQQLSVARLDQLDQEIVEEFRRHGFYGAPLWTPLNALAKKAGLEDRDELRRIRFELWQRLRGLLRAGVLHRFGRARVTTTKLQAQHAVRRMRPLQGGSTFAQPGDAVSNPAPNHLSLNLLRHFGPSRQDEETKSAPTTLEVTRAARLLALMRRKRWSGWIGATRSYRGMPVRLHNRRQAFIFGVLRGQAVVTFEPDGAVGDPTTAGVLWSVVPANTLRIPKSDAAALLGSRKAGSKERPSTAKGLAARLNGLKPCRAGRRRGRPRNA